MTLRIENESSDRNVGGSRLEYSLVKYNKDKCRIQPKQINTHTKYCTKYYKLRVMVSQNNVLSDSLGAQPENDWLWCNKKLLYRVYV